MPQAYDPSAPKKPINLSINGDLLAKAKSLSLDPSATLEKALSYEVREAERAQWLTRNRDAIAASNGLAELKGLFADSCRND